MYHEGYLPNCEFLHYDIVLLQKKPINPYWKLTCGLFSIVIFVAANIAHLVCILKFSLYQ